MKLLQVLPAILLVSCVGVPNYPYVPVSETDSTVVTLTISENNAGLNKRQYLGGLYVTGDDTFKKATAVLWQRDAATCNHIDVPSLTISPEKHSASGRVNTGDLVTFQVFHNTNNGLRGESGYGYFVPVSGAEYTIVDEYDGTRPTEFTVSLIRTIAKDDEVTRIPLDIHALKEVNDHILQDCWNRPPA